MYKVLVLLFLVIGVQSVSFFDLVHEQWEAFKLTYQKSYDNPTEETYRMKIFMENYHNIVKQNQLYEQGLITYKSNLNKWADMLHYEFVEILNGFNRSLSTGHDIKSEDDAVKFIPAANVKLPDQVDWRQSGAVTAVKDQGQCGSCWAFSTTGSLEGQTFRKTNQLVSLSEQNLLDCSGAYGNYGCSGGLMISAFQYIKDNNGLDTEAYYPYEATEDVCRYNSANSGATLQSYSIINPGSEEDLESAVATVGPISVAIDASQDSFQFYSQGIYYEPLCSSSNLDHAVLVVGYGTENGQDYWLVKNSWGTTWGDVGYIKMARNMENNCGIATMASFPLV